MIHRHYLVLAALLLAAHVTGCRSTRPTTERPSAGIAARYTPARPDSTAAPCIEQPAGILSGIGTVFSTPAGIARRQAVRLARAAVPQHIKVKDGAFSWGGDAVAIGKKAGPSLIKSDSATLQVATNAVAGRGNTATQTATAAAPRDWVGMMRTVALGAAVLVGLYFFWPVLWPVLLALFRRRKDPVL